MQVETVWSQRGSQTSQFGEQWRYQQRSYFLGIEEKQKDQIGKNEGETK